MNINNLKEKMVRHFPWCCRTSKRVTGTNKGLFSVLYSKTKIFEDYLLVKSWFSKRNKIIRWDSISNVYIDERIDSNMSGVATGPSSTKYYLVLNYNNGSEEVFLGKNSDLTSIYLIKDFCEFMDNYSSQMLRKE